MYSFRNDYSEGAHPKVLQALVDTNLVQTTGYGTDDYCREAADMIRELCDEPKAEIHFMVGGTQTNLTIIQAFLHSYEAVIAAHTGHVNVHETGAIEATGHKVCTAYSPDGKVTPAMVESVLDAHTGVHMVLPRLVYISDTTEIGTVYTKAELTALRECCDKHGLYLYLDGARLASALTSPENDLTLKDLAALTDAFSIGGTKNGLLFGEALVLTEDMPKEHFEHFRWHIKQRGALLAKGRLLGVQFRALMSDDLYFEIGRHANEVAFRIRDGLAELGYHAEVFSPSNQQFPVMPNRILEQIREMGYEYEEDHKVDEEHTCVRFCTCWATPMSAAEDFLRDLKTCK